MRSRSDTSSDTKRIPKFHVDVLRHRRPLHEWLHDGADELDRPAARRVMRKDRRGPKSPVAERDHRTRLRVLKRESRDARGGRPVGPGIAQTRAFSLLLGKSCHLSEWPTRFASILP